jgi:hypothetical protein
MAFRRQTGVNPVVFSDTIALGFLRAFRPEEIAGGIQQGDAQVLTLSDVNPRPGDRVVVDTKSWQVIGVTPVYNQSDLIGYNLWVRGG